MYVCTYVLELKFTSTRHTYLGPQACSSPIGYFYYRPTMPIWQYLIIYYRIYRDLTKHGNTTIDLTGLDFSLLSTIYSTRKIFVTFLYQQSSNFSLFVFKRRIYVKGYWWLLFCFLVETFAASFFAYFVNCFLLLLLLLFWLMLWILFFFVLLLLLYLLLPFLNFVFPLCCIYIMIL